MGLFDKLTGSRNVTLTPKSALVLSALTVVAADGVIDEAEMLDLQKIVRGDKKAVDVALQAIRAKPQLPEIADMVANVLNEKQRLAVLAILFDLAMADGVLASEEQKVLQMYVDKFGVPEATLKPIIDTVAVKNDFSVFV
ncbi:MAG: tellurite resistance TerB family protein [Methanoregulaceae archaeon]